MSQAPASRIIRWLLPAILVIYVLLGTLYAIYTPAWQAPDEPAHYNYVQYVSKYHRMPILLPGDYPASYLEEIKAARFPPEMSIAPIRYEFHQPPLYYLQAMPVYGLFQGALLPLRLFSVLTGALLLGLVYTAVRTLARQSPELALGTTAFVAFVPMHLTFAAAVNNDLLAELLLALFLLLSIHYVRSCEHSLRTVVLLGLTCGLGLLTKTSAYITLPLGLAAIAACHLVLDPDPPAIRGTVKTIGAFLLPALGLALPWWLRNTIVYGGTDVLGLGRHDQVVAGQMRTAEFIAQHGLFRLVRDFFVTSFRSFWGQFGWMGVLLDPRLYQVLGILSLLAVAGFVFWSKRVTSRRTRIAGWQWAAGGLLALSGLCTLSAYIWYNTNFLQHQGRYLFPALLPIGLAFALGWREALRRDQAWILAGLLLGGALLLRAVGLLSNWPLFLASLAALALGIRYVLPPFWDPLLQAVPYLLLIGLDVASLFGFIVPQLTV